MFFDYGWLRLVDKNNIVIEKHEFMDGSIQGDVFITDTGDVYGIVKDVKTGKDNKKIGFSDLNFKYY